MTPRHATPPLTEDDLHDALLPFGRSRMLPRAAYTSDEVFAWELEHLHAGLWTCVGWAARMAGPGSLRAVQIGSTGVLLARGADGELRAFANLCRHRGHELLARDALVFVNASGDGPPLAEQVGELGELAAPYRAAELLPLVEHEYLLAANWKVICENYHECYHCPLIHPELCRVSPPDSGRNYSERAGAWVGGSMDLRDHAETMSADGRSLGVPIPGLDGELLRTVLYVGLLPNLLLSPHPDYVMTHVIEPLGPARSKVTCTWAFPRGAVERPGFDPAYATGFWDTTNRQDWAACESVQRGLASPHHRPGPLAPNEDAVHAFVSMLADAYLGARPAAL